MAVLVKLPSPTVYVWLSGNALVSVVTPYQAQLVPRWVTVLGLINHLTAEPGTWLIQHNKSIAPWVGTNKYPAKDGGVNSHIS